MRELISTDGTTIVHDVVGEGPAVIAQAWRAGAWRAGAAIQTSTSSSA